MDLSALADFNFVAAHGSLGKASRSSGQSKATLSRRIRALEESLGVRLFERGARSLRLTDEGLTLYQRTERLLGEIMEIGESVSEGMTQPRGHLRVSAPVLFSHTVLGQLAARFTQLYPDVRLEITAEDRKVDLVDDGYDVAIRVNPRPDENLVGRCFVRDEMLVVAAPAFAHLLAETSGAQVRVPAVAMTNTVVSAPWQAIDGDITRTILPDIRLRLSSLSMIRDAVRAGAGAALLPRSMLGEDAAHGRLEVWGKVPKRTVEIWVLHNSRRLVSPKIAAFVSFLSESFPGRVL